jgi:hypothetical protein
VLVVPDDRARLVGRGFRRIELRREHQRFELGEHHRRVHFGWVERSELGEQQRQRVERVDLG